MIQSLWKTVWQFLTKLNILLPYDPAIPLLGIYPNELKTYVHTQTYTQRFTAALLKIAKLFSQISSIFLHSQQCEDSSSSASLPTTP